jgi:hypothetical protein
MTTNIEKPNDVTEATDGGLLSPPPCSQFPIWVLGGRDANTFRKGNMDKIQRRPWKVASFATQAEADACILGIQAAVGGMLTTVAFVDEEMALRIDRNVCTKLGIVSSANAEVRDRLPEGGNENTENRAGGGSLH